jgi:uncharacterized repeat protein (TIGR01451 family)
MSDTEVKSQNQSLKGLKKKASKEGKPSKGKFLNKVISFVKEKPFIFLALLAILVGGATIFNASALVGDCDSNAIVYCGGFKEGGSSAANQTYLNENISKRHGPANVGKIMGHYGIDTGRIASLPVGEVRQDGTIWLNGKPVATNAKTTGRQELSGVQNTRVDLGGGVVIYERSTSRSIPGGGAKAWVKLDGNGRFLYAVLRSCANPTTGTPTYTPPPPPPPPPTGAVKCDALAVEKLSRTKFKFTVKGSKSGAAKLTGYLINFGDGGAGGSATSKTSASYTHEYKTTGSYKIQAGAAGSLNGKTIGDGGPSCAKTVQVEAATGAVKCDALAVEKLSRTKFKFTVKGSKSGAAKLTGYLINFGDGGAGGSATTKTSASYTHEYKTTGSYKIQAGAAGSLNGKTIGDGGPSCAKTVQVEAATGAVKCDALAVEKLSRTKFKFTVKGSKSGAAKLTGYLINFGDGGAGGSATTNTTASYTHEYKKTGNFKIQAGTAGELNGKKIGDGGPSCAASVEIKPEPKTPNYTIKKYVKGNDAQNNNSAVSVKSGEEFDYKIVVSNTGEVELKDVKVWDVLPEGVTYTSGSLKLNGEKVNGDANFFDSSKGITIGSIAIGKSAEFTLKAKIKVAAENSKPCTAEVGYYINVAKSDPKSTEPNLGEKEDPAVIKCKEIPKVENPAVDIEKDVSKYEVEINEEFDWKLVVTNNGNVDLKDVKVFDTAPEGVEFINSENVDGAQSVVTQAQFDATISLLKVGEVKEFVIKSKVVSGTGEEITNTACVDAPAVTDQGENPEKDDCDDAKVKTPEPLFCTVPGFEDLAYNDPNCKKPEKCPIPGLESFDADNPNCKPGVVAPSETPSTGGGALVAMAAVSLMIGGSVYAFALRGGKRSA